MTQRLPFALLVTLLVAASAACNVGSLGSSGEFRFTDETPELESDFSREVDRPLATGAVMELKIRRVGGEEHVADATSSDTAVLEVVQTGTDWVKVRGLAAGTATLSVTGASGTEDSIELEVRAIGSTQIEVIPWDPLVRLDNSLWSGGVALLTNSNTRAFALHKDASGGTLSGYGAVDCAAEEGLRAVRADDSDFLTLTSGDTKGAFALTCGESSMDVSVVGEEDVASLALYSQTDNLGPATPETPLELEAGRNFIMHVPAYTADGTYVIGAGAEPIHVTSPEGSVVTISVDPVTAAAEAEAAAEESEEEDAGQGQADLARILANGRAFIIDANGLGDTTVTVTWAGQTVEIPVTVR